MPFLKHFFIGLMSYFRAIGFIYKHQLWYYFVFPLACSLLLYFWGYTLQRDLYAYDLGNPETIRQLIGEMIQMLLLYSLAFISIEMRKYIVLVVLSPLIGNISLKTEALLTGKRYPFSWKQYVNDIKRALRIIFGNFVIQYGISLVWIILSLIFSPLRPYTGGVLLAIGFYFYGFGMMDYMNERRRLNIEESVNFVRRHAGFALAIGGVFSMMFLIPYEIGVTFAPVLAIVAATIGMHRILEPDKK